MPASGALIHLLPPSCSAEKPHTHTHLQARPQGEGERLKEIVPSQKETKGKPHKRNGSQEKKLATPSSPDILDDLILDILDDTDNAVKLKVCTVVCSVWVLWHTVGEMHYGRNCGVYCVLMTKVY